MDILTVGLGIAVCAAVAVAAWVLQSALGEPERFHGRFGDESGRTTPRRRVLVGTALTGVFIVYAAAYYGLLFWLGPLGRLLGTDADPTFARMTFAALFAGWSVAATIRVFSASEDLRQLRRARSTLRAMESLVEAMSQGRAAGVARSELRLGDADLRGADEQWIGHQARLLGEAQARWRPQGATAEAPTVRNVAPPQDQAKTLEEEAAGRLAVIQGIETALPSEIRDRSREILDLAEAFEGIPRPIGQKLLIETWAPLNAVLERGSVDSRAADAGEREIDLGDALAAIPGIRAPHGAVLLAGYTGTPHGGETRFRIKQANGAESDVVQALRFDPDVRGALAAFYVAHVLPTKGRFWHGRYDHDYMIFPHALPFTLWLMRAGYTGDDREVLGRLEGKAAVCVAREADAIVVQAFGAGKTTPLTRFTTIVRDGVVVQQNKTTILESRIRVLH